VPDPPACALGLVPHSGWAAVVVLGGTVAAPLVLARERLAMADDSLPGSRQPYHALEGSSPAEARTRLARFEVSAATLALAGLAEILARSAAPAPRSAGILAAAGRSGAPLEAILASHALIHSADGEHFRAALARACERLGIAVARIPRRDLPQRAAAALGEPPAALTARIKALGRSVGPPWSADQKSAALIAWLLLAGKE
jgi:hypothetical protein